MEKIKLIKIDDNVFTSLDYEELGELSASLYMVRAPSSPVRYT